MNYTKIHHLDATYCPSNGPMGCCISHIKAIELAIENKWDKVLILEDDFIFLQNKEKTNELINRFFDLTINGFEKSELKWDILMLSSNLYRIEKTNWDFLNRVIEGKTTSGYLINSHYYETILNNFKEALKHLDAPAYKKQLSPYCIDMSWRVLQPVGNWFIINPKIGIQKEGYSDIEKRNVKYNC
jgi:GR25 family glycosyltransferase involved in LPS biosynthesis